MGNGLALNRSGTESCRSWSLFKWVFAIACSLAWLPSAVAGLITPPVDVGTLSPGDVKVYDVVHPAGMFADSFNFTLVDIGTETFGMVIEFQATTVLNIADLTLQLYDGFDASGALLATGTPSPTNLAFQTALAPSDYSVLVSGNAVGTQGGAYTNILAVSTVPEPSTVSLMLAGMFGLYGLTRVGRRPKRIRHGDFI